MCEVCEVRTWGRFATRVFCSGSSGSGSRAGLALSVILRGRGAIARSAGCAAARAVRGAAGGTIADPAGAVAPAFGSSTLGAASGGKTGGEGITGNSSSLTGGLDCLWPELSPGAMAEVMSPSFPGGIAGCGSDVCSMERSAGAGSTDEAGASVAVAAPGVAACVSALAGASDPVTAWVLVLAGNGSAVLLSS